MNANHPTPLAPNPPWYFSLFRILFGAYLATHFAQLLPYASELFGSTGIIPDPSLNPTHRLALLRPDAPWIPGGPSTFISVLLTASLTLTAGIARRTSAIILWIGWTALFHRNNLISNPSLPFVGFLLLILGLIPAGEPARLFQKPKPDWQFPVHYRNATWLLLATAYSFSGITKFQSPSWLDGSALRDLLDNPLSRANLLRDALLLIPDPLLRLGTWSVLVLETAFLPLALSRHTQPWISLALTLMHLGILTLIDFADLTLPFLLLHLFTFRHHWIPALQPSTRFFIARFDSSCLLCNAWIRWLAHSDTNDHLRFQGLGPDSAKASTMIVDDGQTHLTESSAVITLLAALGGLPRAAATLLSLIPSTLRNLAYRRIARSRHLFRQLPSRCSLPSPELQRKILP